MVRLGVEERLGVIISSFEEVGFNQNIQLLKSPIGKYDIVAALLKSAHAHAL